MQFLTKLANNCFHFAKKSCNLTFFQLSFIFTVMLIGFYPVYALPTDMFYVIARGAGGTLKFLLPFLFFPTLRMINAQCYQFFSAIPQLAFIRIIFQNRTLIHKTFAWSFIGFSLIHTLAHLLRASVALLAIESISGIIMLGALAFPIVLIYLIHKPLTQFFHSLQHLSYHSQFIIPHQLGWSSLLVAFALHTHDLRLLPLSLGVLGIFSVDKLWEWIKSNEVKVLHVKTIHEKMIVIKVEKPKNYRYQTGQIVYLNKIHPFTIASSPNEKSLRFVISDNGQWSRDLVQNLKNGDYLRLSPAFPSPLEFHDFNPSEEKLLMSSGAGVAMPIGYLYQNKKRSPSHIIHSTRKVEEIALLHRCATKAGIEVNKLEFYLSQHPQAIDKEPLLSKLNIHAGRLIPEQDPILHHFKGKIYYCGNDELGNEIEKVAMEDPKKTVFRERFT